MRRNLSNTKNKLCEKVAAKWERQNLNLLHSALANVRQVVQAIIVPYAP